MNPHGSHAQLIDLLGNPTAARGLDTAQWSGLIANARAANLLGALAVRLKDAGMSAGQQADRHLDGARQLSVRQHQSVRWEVFQLQAALGDLKLPVVLLKGAAYVMSGRSVGRGRLFGDIDILVPRASLGDVESRLMLKGWVSAKSSAYDQRYYRQWMHELPPMSHIRRGTVLDVHHTILPLTARHAPDPGQIIARAVPLATEGLGAIYVPCPEDLVIHSITHLVHEGELHNGLRDLNDIDCMLRSFSDVPGFWDRLSAYSVGNDLAWPVCFGLHLVKHFFGTPIPDAMLATLSPNGSAQQPAPWLKTIYAFALNTSNIDQPNIVTDLALWLLYVRAHALRMPVHLVIPHLVRKAWMRRFPDEKRHSA